MSIASLALYSVAALVVGFVVVAVLIAALSPPPAAQPVGRSPGSSAAAPEIFVDRDNPWNRSQ